MNCQEFAELRTPYLFGDLEGAQQDRAQQHLQSCLPCRKQLDDDQAILARLDSVRIPSSPATDPDTVRTRSQPRHHTLWLRRVAVLVLGLSIATALLALLNSEVRVDDGSVTVRLSWRPTPALEPNGTAGRESFDGRFREIEQRIQEDLMTLAMSVDLAREESNRQHAARLAEMEMMTLRELMAQRTAIDHVVTALQTHPR